MGNKPKKPITGRAVGPPRKLVPELAHARLLVPSRPETFLVRWSKFDIGGPWCVKHPGGNLADLLGRIKSFETMTPLELFGTKKNQLGTDYEVASIPNTTTGCDRLRRRDSDQCTAHRRRPAVLGLPA